MYTHNFFPYPAKFPPGPIQEFIDSYSKEGDRILDPFCGSGTVLVESILHNRSSVGIELNPVSALVSKAKAKIYSESDIQQLKYFIDDLLYLENNRQAWIKDNLTDSDLPDYKNVNHWFKRNMLEELASIRKLFRHNEFYNDKIRDLLWVAFLKIIVQTSNQDTDTRYTAVEKPQLVEGYAILKMKETVNDYIKTLSSNLFLIDLVLNGGEPHAEVLEGDTLQMLPTICDESIDLVITSPPYINTYDYYLYHKHRIFWMDRDPQVIRRQEVGCHHRVDTMTYEKAYNEYRQYLSDVLRGIYPKLKSDKHLVMLIGDGIVKGETVLADKLLSEISSENGYIVKEVRTINIREVSRGFIKGKTLDKKNHHSIIIQKT